MSIFELCQLSKALSINDFLTLFFTVNKTMNFVYNIRMSLDKSIIPFEEAVCPLRKCTTTGLSTRVM